MNHYVPEAQDSSKSYWCWAAVAKCVSHAHNPQSSWTQCKIATDTLSGVVGGADCCDPGSSIACDQAWYLELALKTTLNDFDVRSGVPDFDVFAAEIDLQKPMCVRIEWPGFGIGHFISVSGWKRTLAGVELVEVADPATGGIAQIRFDELVHSYGANRGRSSHTYWTQP